MKMKKRSVMYKKMLRMMLLFGLLAMILSACSLAGNSPTLPATLPVPTSQTQTDRREAQVQSVEIQVLQTDPIQVKAIINGSLTESCATLGEYQVQYASNTFQINLPMVIPADQDCIPVVTPFKTTILLDTSGVPAGTYTVIANGVSSVFILPAGDSATPGTSAPTSTPSTDSNPIVLIIVPNTAIPGVISTSVPTSRTCVDSAAFVTDVSIPDSTVMAPGTPFTKTWRLKNTGSCTWDSSYLIHYISGSTMTQQPGYWIVPQGQTVTPGQTVDISVGMTSPTENGTYKSYWGLKKENGQFMPIQGGANGNSFYVKIGVDNGTNGSAGKITAVSIDIELEQGSGTVCTADSTYFVRAYITADGPTTATYEIGSTAGQISAGYFTDGYLTPVSPVEYGTVSFDQAGTKTISYRFVGPYPYPSDITVLIRVNGGEWHNSKLLCQ